MNNCPVCKKTTLSHVTLENTLPARECTECHGIWISSNDYLMWIKTLEDEPQQETAVDDPLPATDSDQLTICADCGHILRRYKIWPDVDFHLDRCETCNGVWLDHNEWDALKDRLLHRQINTLFTHTWQEKIREEEVAALLERMYVERFGEEDYSRIQNIRGWIENHPKSAYLMAYLTDKEPLRIQSVFRVENLQ